MVAAIVMATVAGCGSTSREAQLERVARDWCLTIRASQLVPVYPMTEDLRPGDVFLVTTPIEGQVREYRRRGFLPLDKHVARLRELDYATFYESSHGIGENRNTPYHWMFPPAPSATASADDPDDDADAAAADDDEIDRRVDRAAVMPCRTGWHLAPRAFFPSYEFSVTRGGGLALAIPVSSVPVGLGLLATDSAVGSIQLSDGYVYGVSESELTAKIERWAIDHRATLAAARAQNPRGVYLRVVNRVYLVGSVQVFLGNRASGEAFGRAGADVGTPPGLESFAQQPDDRTPDGRATDGRATDDRATDDRAADGRTRLRDLSDAITAGMPGGAVRLQFASSRAILADETFARPLVVGYLGLDYPVREDGTLGAAVTTLDTLSGNAPASTGIGEPTDDQGLNAALLTAIESMGGDRATRGFDAAAERLPTPFQGSYRAARAEGEPARDAFEFAYDEFASRPSLLVSAFDAQVREALLDGWRIARAQ